MAIEELSACVENAEGLRKPRLAASCAKAKSMLEANGQAAVTRTPYLVRASVHRHELSGLRLVVSWLERNPDVTALRIREYWRDGTSVDEVTLLPLPERRSMRQANQALYHARAFGLKERATPSVRAQAEQMIPLTAREAAEERLSQEAVGLPRVLMAIPSEEVVVLVSLIDDVGHESQAVAAVSMLRTDDEEE
jgi:hypothetical protein